MINFCSEPLCNTSSTLLERGRHDDSLFVLGGASILARAVNEAQRRILTLIVAGRDFVINPFARLQCHSICQKIPIDVACVRFVSILIAPLRSDWKYLLPHP
jgi:hypothetical protein